MWGSVYGMHRGVRMESMRGVRVECRGCSMECEGEEYGVRRGVHMGCKRGARMKCVRGSACSAPRDVWGGEGAHVRWEGCVKPRGGRCGIHKGDVKHTEGSVGNIYRDVRKAQRAAEGERV